MNSSIEKISSSDCKQKKFNLSDIPLRALRIKSRTFLSKCLNAIQVIPTQSGLPRDYRGIADLFGLDNLAMNSIERASDPVKIILETVEKEFKVNETGDKYPYTIQDLIYNLEMIERFDIIDDLISYFNDDAEFHLKKMQKLPRRGVAHDLLTIDDRIDEEESAQYDAYVCYADDDIDFVTFLADYLESPQIGLRLFIRDRDLLLGTMRYDAYTKLIEERCNYVIIVLTPEFVESEECKYQTLFATDLAIQDRERKLIPIILRSCNIPPFVRLMSKIDFSRRDSKWEWIWRKLIFSISSKPMIITSPPSYPRITYHDNLNSCQVNGKNNCNPQQRQQPQHQIAHQISSVVSQSEKSSKPVNNVPPTLTSSQITSTISIQSLESLPPVPKNPLISKSDLFDSGKAESISLESQTSATINSSPVALKTTTTKKNWIKSIKQKLAGLGSSDSSANGYNSLNNCDQPELQ